VKEEDSAKRVHEPNKSVSPQVVKKTQSQSRTPSFAGKIAEEVTRFYDGENAKDKENANDQNLWETTGKHFTKALARKETGQISLGVSFWAGYSNKFMTVECTGSDTTHSVLEKCMEQHGKHLRVGDAMQLFTQKEFIRPQFKKALATYAQDQMPSRSGLKTLSQANIKDGDMLHVLSARGWTNKKPKNMEL
jgi:hypothetical protein